MIRLVCANCQAQLEVDDAFAGGVCRCKHCGAIQTVPRSSRATTVGKALAGHGVGGDEPRTLYSAKSRAGMASTPSGLEELAEAVHSSSGLGSGLLNRPQPRGPRVPVAPQKKSNTMLWGVIGVVAALAIAAGVWLATANNGKSQPAVADAGTAQGPAKPAATFAGVTLEGKKVVYVLDRGDATSSYFPSLKDLTLASVKSLGPDRQFQVVLWDNGNGPDAYPALMAAYASPTEVAKLAQWFDAVNTGGSTEATSAVRQAMTGQPDVCILCTGKSLQIGESFADAVLSARPPRTVFHTFTLGGTGPDDPLRTIAKATQGRFTSLDNGDLAGVAK